MSMSPHLAHMCHACALDLPLPPECRVADAPFYSCPDHPGRHFGLSRSLRSRLSRRASSCELDHFLQFRPPAGHSHPQLEWCRRWERHYWPALHSRSGAKRSMLQRKPVIRPQQCHQALELPQQRKIFTGSPCAMDQSYVYTSLSGCRPGLRNSGLFILHDQRQYPGTSAGKRCILERGRQWKMEDRILVSRIRATRRER